MANLEDVIQRGVDLNNAIRELNRETSVINGVVAEKRSDCLKVIEDELRICREAMERLDIDLVDFPTGNFICYSCSNKEVGIRIRKWKASEGAIFQMDVGVLSNVMDGFYAYHSLGRVVSGVRNENLLCKILDKWNNISPNIERCFAKSIEKILNERQAKAVSNRETAINTLTNMVK